MQDHNDLLKKRIDNLVSYTNKWKLKVEQQSPIASYHTTQMGQLSVINLPTQEAKSLRVLHNGIQLVMDEYHSKVESIYPPTHLGMAHKHYRTHALKNSFKAEYASLTDLATNLAKLREQKQNLTSDGSASFDSSNANSVITSRRLNELKENITRAKEAYDRGRRNYCKRVREIYEECRILEKDRLNLITETLMKFIDVAYPSENPVQQRQVYEEIAQYLKIEQNSTADLDFWAQKYRIYDSPSTSSRSNHHSVDLDSDSISVRRMRTSARNQKHNDTSVAENALETASEDEEESSKPKTTASAT